jgi:hypothetical protein
VQVDLHDGRRHLSHPRGPRLPALEVYRLSPEEPPFSNVTYTGRMIRQFDATETRLRSLLERPPGHPALPDDGQQRADGELTVVWDGNRDTTGVGATLHDDMTSAPAHLDEPVLLKDPTDFASRQDAKSTHASLRSSLQRYRSEADA